MRLYVGNIPYQATEEDLQNWFTQAEISVQSISVVRDRYSGESRGFGFVEIASDDDAQRAIETLNGKNFLGRNLVINESRPREEHGGGGRPGGGGGRSRRT